MNLRSGHGIRLWLLAFSLAVLSLVAGPQAMAAGCFGDSPMPAHVATTATAMHDHHAAERDQTDHRQTDRDQTDHRQTDHGAQPGCGSHGCCVPQLVVQRILPPARMLRADLVMPPTALQPWRQASGLFRPPRQDHAEA